MTTRIISVKRVNPPFPSVENLKGAMKLLYCPDVAKRVGIFHLHDEDISHNMPHCMTWLLLKKRFHASEGEVGL